jgi:uncharacterized protein (TIGR02118 family)
MRTKIGLLILALTFVFGFRQIKSTGDPVIKKGMIRVAILYPGGEGKTFDMDYYSKKHIPLVQQLLGDAMKGASIDKGIGSNAPGAAAPYVAIGYLYFETLAAYQDGMKANIDKIRADIPNYTNITPVVQVSEVIQ